MSSQNFSHYNYDPSLAAAIVAASLYCFVLIFSFIQWIHYRAWIWIFMIIAAAMECIGYISRCLSIKSPDNTTLYSLAFCMIILAPVLMAGNLYVLFGRIVFHVIPTEARTTRLLWVPPRWLTPIFVACDVVALFLQLVGVVIITSVNIFDKDAKSKLNKGKTIAEIGVAVQLICFGLFSFIALRFNFTSKRFTQSFDNKYNSVQDGKHFTIDDGSRNFKKNWQTILRVTNFASVCILIRSVYRMVDFALGRTGYTASHEWCLYIFDGLVIFPVLALFLWWHPSKYLPYLGIRLPRAGR